MPNIEKVIKGLECCSKTDMCCMEISCYHPAYLECPYHEIEDGCIQALTKDALALLKDYRQHLQNDLETLKEEKQRLEFESQATFQPHPCKECNKYGCDVHCPYYGK